MAYAPGVTDISGQLLAQGVLGRAQAYGSGMNGIAAGLQVYHQKKEADQDLLAKASSTEKFIKSHSDLFGGDEVADAMTATNPNETPLAKYNRLTQVVQDTMVGSKIAQDQQQVAANKQAMAAQAFAMQQAQLKAQQQQAQQARLQQILGLGAGQGGGGGGGGQWPGSGTGPWSNPTGGATPPPPNMAGPGMAAMGGGQPPPAMPPQGMAPPIDPATAQALQYFRMTGQAPNEQAAASMMGDTSRMDVAQTRADAAQQIRNAADETRSAVENAKRQIDQAKIDAKNAPPTFTQHPETGLWMMTQNGQTQALPGQVAKDPLFAEIDRQEKSGDLTHKEALAAKQNLIYHRGSFSPNGMQGLAAVIQGVNNPGAAPAAGAPTGPTMTQDQFYGRTPAAPGAPAAAGMVKIKTPSGTIMNIPAANLPAALAKGAVQLP